MLRNGASNGRNIRVLKEKIITTENKFELSFDEKIKPLHVIVGNYYLDSKEWMLFREESSSTRSPNAKIFHRLQPQLKNPY